ncbi:MAG: DNA topoisomerase III, partial [Clostridia bacterium]|nr:DNA topoisomerase III [Clostridia bacterium]
LMAVCEQHRYEETEVTLEAKGAVFTAKGKRVLNPGWKAFVKKEQEDKELPVLKEWDLIAPVSTEIKEGKTTPPKHYTEDTLLSAMETAGVKEMPEDAERKGLGTPATRAAILEKLVETGFVERQKSKKTVNLIPTQVGRSLITVLPEQLQSPLLTADWENRLNQIEHGDAEADDFIKDITALVEDLVKNYEPVKGSEVLFPSGREEIGKCPRCGSPVTESKKGYFCEKNDCRFGLWRDNKFLSAKKINLTRKMVSALLKEGKTYVSGIFSEKTGKSYDAFIRLEDDGAHTVYKLEFDKENK